MEVAQHHGDKGPLFMAIFGTGTGIAAALVALRFWVRYRIVRKLGSDDWVVLAAVILTFGSLGCCAAAVHHGLGKHGDELTTAQVTTSLKMIWVAFQITPSAEATAKFAITLMFIRITTSKWWRFFFYSLIFLFTLITIASLLTILLSCHPLPRLWDTSVAGTCHEYERTVDIYIQGVMAASYDLILAIAPIFLLWNVQISRQNKIALCALLALGFFTGVAGIMRTVYTPDTVHPTDPTWDIMNFLLWKTTELPLSIIVGTLPTLRPLFDKVKEHSKHRRYYKNSVTLRDMDDNRQGITKTLSFQISSRKESNPQSSNSEQEYLPQSSHGREIV